MGIELAYCLMHLVGDLGWAELVPPRFMTLKSRTAGFYGCDKYSDMGGTSSNT